MFFFMFCDERGSSGMLPLTWVVCCDHHLRNFFTRAIAPGKPTATDFPRVLDDFFGTGPQVLRALDGRSSGLETETLAASVERYFCTAVVVRQQLLGRCWGFLALSFSECCVC